MAVKIRLARRGRKKLALYDVVVADARAPRDGRFTEKLGTYNPLTVPATVEINDERAFHWIMNGAQPTDTVKSVLSYRGVLLKKHLQIGVLKGALTQEQADARLAEWLKEKEAKVKKKAEKLAESKAAERSEEHTSELQSRENLVCRLLLEKKKNDERMLVDASRKQVGAMTMHDLLRAILPEM